jgi:hypothetical protein
MTCDVEGEVCCEMFIDIKGSDTSATGQTGSGRDTATATDTELQVVPSDTGPPRDTGGQTDIPDTESQTDTAGDTVGQTDPGTDAPTDTEGDTETATQDGPPADTATETASVIDTGTSTSPAVNTGATCEEAIVVSALPFSHAGNSSTTGNIYSFDAGACEGVSGARGGGSNDVVYLLTPEFAGRYTISVEGFDAAVYVVQNCGDINGSCVAAADGPQSGLETLEIALAAKQDYYIIVDGWSDTLNIAGAYTLTISGVCTPSCENVECGDDGCGGVCGTCDPGFVCNDAGACVVDDTPGNSCAYPYPVTALPFSFTDDTASMSNLYDVDASACPGLESDIGGGSNDSVYALTPETSGKYTITVDDSFDSALYVVTDCEDLGATCVGGVSTAGVGETLDVMLTAGTVYYIIVDGYDDVGNTDGSYTLTVSDVCVPDCFEKECGDNGCGESCGECGATEVCNDAQTCEVYSGYGDDCADPFIVDAVPYTRTSSTVLAGPDFYYDEGECPGDSTSGSASDDEVYRFTPEQSGVYTLAVDGEYDTVLYVATDCGDIGGSCLEAAANGQGADNDDTMTVKLEADTTYFAVVDGDSNIINENGPYVFTISAPCTPACEGKECGPDGCGLDCGACLAGSFCNEAQRCEAFPGEGDSCHNPRIVASAPASLSGDTSNPDLNNVYTPETDDCEGMSTIGEDAREEVFAFTPNTTGYYTITTSDEFNNILYVVTNCTNLASSCVGGVNDGMGETLSVMLVAGTTYYTIVDGAESPYKEGAYSLTISDVCSPDCEGKSCGDDGCGHQCGTCVPGEFCNDDSACQAYDTPGDSCFAPIAIDALPFTDENRDTTLLNNSYSATPFDCDGLPFAIGGGSSEVVYELTPDVDGVYTFNTQGTYDHSIYVVTDCTAITTSCIAGEEYYSDQETLSVALEAGLTYYIIVDGQSQASNDAGVLTFDAEVPCIPECEGKQCGDDDCGGVCGECGQDEYCDDEGQCQTAWMEGDSCTNPFVVDTIFFEDSGDTSEFNNLYGEDTQYCDGLDGSVGRGSKEVVYSFDPLISGWFLIDVTTPFDSVIYVFYGCEDIANSCVAGVDGYFEGGEILEVYLSSGTEYFIVIDGFDNESNTAGSYVLLIDETDPPEED